MENIGFFDRRTTKGQIIEVLAEEWPLRGREIFFQLKKKYSFTGTYQALHKALKEMVASDVLVFEHGHYSLEHDWVTKAKLHLEGLEKKLKYKEPTADDIAEKKSITIYYDKFIDIGQFVLEKFGNFPDPEHKEFITMVNHTWPAIVLSPRLFKLFKKFHEQNQNYLIIRNDTVIDRMNVKPFIENGAKVKFDKNLSQYPDTLVKGDYVLYAYFDHKGRTIYDQFCKATKSLGNLDIHKLFSTLFETHFKHKLIIVHNADLANAIRENALKRFKKS